MRALTVEPKHTVINDRILVSVRSGDGQGRSLPRAELCRRLDTGELFVATHNANSFDSRNFGPIGSALLRGTLTPLLTF